MYDRSTWPRVVLDRRSFWIWSGHNAHMRRPEGATLFFPVINFVDINTPPTTCGKRVQNAKDLQAETQPAINSIHSVLVTLDGRNITNTVLRLIPQPFEVAFPPDNLFTGCPEGIYSPAV